MNALTGKFVQKIPSVRIQLEISLVNVMLVSEVISVQILMSASQKIDVMPMQLARIQREATFVRATWAIVEMVKLVKWVSVTIDGVLPTNNVYLQQALSVSVNTGYVLMKQRSYVKILMNV